MLRFLSTFCQRETGAQRAEGVVELQRPTGWPSASPRARSTLPLNLFESGMRDAADATHALEGSIRPKALEMLLAFMCEGECEIDEGQLTEVLAIGSRLGGRAGGCKKAKKPPMGVG